MRCVSAYGSAQRSAAGRLAMKYPQTSLPILHFSGFPPVSHLVQRSAAGMLSAQRLAAGILVMKERQISARSGWSSSWS